MQSLKHRLLVAFLTFTCLSLAVARTSVDGKVKFPADEPTFTLELPAGWTYEADKDGNLDCAPGDDSGYMLTVLLLPQISSQKELKAALPKLAKTMADGAKLKNFATSDVESDKNGNGISFSGIAGQGEMEGTDFVVFVHGFETKKGKFYALVTAGSEKADKKHEKNYDAITASIEPLEE